MTQHAPKDYAIIIAILGAEKNTKVLCFVVKYDTKYLSVIMRSAIHHT